MISDKTRMELNALFKEFMPFLDFDKKEYELVANAPQKAKDAFEKWLEVNEIAKQEQKILAD